MRPDNVSPVSATHATVMLVDDDDMARESVSLVLATRGFRVLEHASGRSALEALRRGEHPDLILLDLMMPHMDGWEFRRRQLAEGTLAAIPVVAMSGSRAPRAEAIDASAFLAKPLVAAELLGTVEGLLAKEDGGDARADGGDGSVIRRQRRMFQLGVRKLRRARPRPAPARSRIATLHQEEHLNRQLSFVSRAVSHVANNALQGLMSYVQCPFTSEETDEELQRAAFDSAWHCAEVLRRFAACTIKRERDPCEALGAFPAWILDEWRRCCAAPVELRVSGLTLLRDAQVSPELLLFTTRELITNAVEAVTTQGQGCVTVRVRQRSITRAALRTALPVCNRRPALWCCLDVLDNGLGISASELPLIWLPFYSSKFADRGLGLSEVLARVGAQGGLVDAKSAANRGTRVRLMFPVASAPAL